MQDDQVSQEDLDDAIIEDTCHCDLCGSSFVLGGAAGWEDRTVNSRKVEERYADDASFRALVDMLMNFIMACEFSPSELRDAAVLAAIRYETMYSRPVYVRNPDGGIDRIDSYHRKDGRIGL